MNFRLLFFVYHEALGIGIGLRIYFPKAIVNGGDPIMEFPWNDSTLGISTDIERKASQKGRYYFQQRCFRKDNMEAKYIILNILAYIRYTNIFSDICLVILL